MFISSAAGLTRSRAQTLIEQGRVTLDGNPVKPNKKTKAGEVYTLDFPEEQKNQLLAEPIPIEVIYQDEDIAVINKPRGMAVHPSPGISGGTLANALLASFDSLSGINGESRPGIVHRLDKDTTGALIIAKNDNAHLDLSQQLKDRTLKRVYLALVEGIIKEDSGTVDMPIARAKRDRKRMAVVEGGRRAVTNWRVLERFSDCTLVECSLVTGRTHQIRVHMAYIGHPVVNDPVYGIRKKRKKATGQFLHAAKLSFIHPRTKEFVQCTADLPKDFSEELEKLRKRF